MSTNILEIRTHFDDAKIERIETGAGGNTSILPQSKKQVSQLKRWCFTCNNYEDHWIEIIERALQQICEKFIFQEEICPNTGTPHLQGGIWLKKRARPNELILIPGQKWNRIHWEDMKSQSATYDYCMKEDSRKPDGKTISWGFPEEPEKVEIIIPTYKWQKDLIKILDQKADRRTIHWYWNETGNVGKSVLTAYLQITRGAVMADGNSYADIINLVFNADMNRKGGAIMLWDMPRAAGNRVSYKAMEVIKNGVISNTKYETGNKFFNPPHVVVFANCEPDLAGLSRDRWNIVEINLTEEDKQMSETYMYMDPWKPPESKKRKR